MKRRRAGAAVGAAVLLAAGCSTSGDAPHPSAPAEPGLSWSAGAAMPTPRTEVAAAALDGRVYVAGGFTDDGRASAVVEAYDAAGDVWSGFVALPEAVHHAAMVSFGDRLVLIGGYREGGAATGDVWSIRPGEAGWTKGPSLPLARGAHAAAVALGRIHVIGGAGGFGGSARLLAEHHVLTSLDSQWQEAEAFPAPRDHLSAAGLEGLVVVAGGRQLSLESNSARADIFDVASGEWRRGPPMPTARGGLAAAAWIGRVAVAGGEDPEGTFDEVELLDPDGSWTSALPLPTARHGLGAAAIGDVLIVVGGGPRPGLSTSGATEMLRRAV